MSTTTTYPMRAAGQLTVRAMTRALCVAAIAMLPWVSTAADLGPLDDQNAADNAMLTLADVGAPAGRMLLIRRGSDRCAVRFTTFHRGHNAKAETSFNSGAESFFAEYDWFYPRVGAPGAKVVYDTGHRSVASEALVGIGRLAFQPGDDEIRCGPFRLFWGYPVRVGFFPRGGVGADIGIELAPTKASSIDQVNFDDPRIHWYKTDQARKPMLIPLAELP